MQSKSMTNKLPPSRRLSVAWPPFAQKLAAVLGKLEEDQFLILSEKRTSQYVQFAAQGAFGMRAETASNEYLTKDKQLNKRQISTLIEDGWHAPTNAPECSTPKDDPDGSPNFFFDFPATMPFNRMAAVAVRTLAEVLRVPHPGYLAYDAFDTDGNAIPLPELGLKRASRSQPADQFAPLPQLLLETIKEMTGIDDLDFDGDGDIGIRYGTQSAFVRLMEKPPYVRIYSGFLENVEETPGLLARLNEFNSSTSHLRFFVLDGTIFAVSDVPAAPFESDHVTYSLQDFLQTVDGISSLLHAEFGGNAAYFEAMPSSLKH